MEKTPPTRSVQGPFNVHAPRSHRNRGWKVKRRAKLAYHHLFVDYASRAGQDPSNVHAPRNRRSRGCDVKRRMKLSHHHHHHIHGEYLSSETQRITPTPPLMQFMKYEVPAVLVLLALKYPAETHSRFQENPAPLWCFVAASSAYWLIVGAVKQMTTLSRKWFQRLSNAALASGILSTISLFSIFLPYPVSLLPLLTILISLPVALVLPYACRLFLRGIECVVNRIHAVLVWARRLRNLRVEAPLPV